jgi:hypothetical protein
MSATGTLGTKLYISSTPLANINAAADAITDFQMLTIDQEVAPLENLGEFSRQFEVVRFNAIGDGRTLKIKGPFDDGQLSLSAAFDLSEPGQLILFNACKTPNQDVYPFKMTFVGTDAYFAVCYFGGLPMSYRINAGAANSILRATINIEVDTEVFIGDS